MNPFADFLPQDYCPRAKKVVEPGHCKRDYPAVLNDLDFRFKTREQKGVTSYGLRAGPFANYTQATAFCEIAKRMGQTCVTAPFIGEML